MRLEGGLESSLIHREVLPGRHLLRQFRRKPKGIVKPEYHVAAQFGLAGRPGSFDGFGKLSFPVL